MSGRTTFKCFRASPHYQFIKRFIVIDTIFNVIVEKWNLSLITSKFQLQLAVIRKVRSCFKKLIKQSSKLRKLGLQRKYGIWQRRIDWIKRHLKSLSEVHYTVEDVRQKFIKEFTDKPKLSKDTIQRIMKNDLHIKYKKLDTCNHTVLRHNNIRLFWESIAIKWELLSFGYEIV